MIDKSKRKTLKVLAATTTATIATSLHAGALNSSGSVESEIGRVADAVTDKESRLELGQIEVSRRVSATHNDLEIVITNTGEQPVTVTDMTPRTLQVARGEFNFSALLEKGPLRLEAAESVRVPLQRTVIESVTLPGKKTQVLFGSQSDSLVESMRRSMSIVTDSNAFASVTIVEHMVA